MYLLLTKDKLYAKERLYMKKIVIIYYVRKTFQIYKSSPTFYHRLLKDENVCAVGISLCFQNTKNIESTRKMFPSRASSKHREAVGRRFPLEQRTIQINPSLTFTEARNLSHHIRKKH